MSSTIVLHHFDAARFDQASELLAGLHPVDEACLRDVFRKCGACATVGMSFDAFWDLAARTRAAEILTGDRDAIRKMLAAALVSIAGEAAWSVPHGLAEPIHAIVGVDPPTLKALYRLSGGPPRIRGTTSGASDDLARVFDARIETGMDIEIPARYATEPGEPGLLGAWSSDSLADLLPHLERVDTREKVEVILTSGGRGWWARLSGEAARRAELRPGVEAAWPAWATIVEAVRATLSQGGTLGLATR